MLVTPFPHQIEGAAWLSGKQFALLADEPRVGKTGTAIMAADDNFDASIIVVTTASGKPVWKRAFKQWSSYERPDLTIVGWPDLNNNTIRAQLLKRVWDKLILDESHYAKNFEAKRTQAVYGLPIEDGLLLDTSKALISKVRSVWPLTGTPIPNALNDLYPMMRALCPERLREDRSRGWPDVTKYSDFRDRYCHWYMKALSPWRRIPVVTGGKREDELNARLKGFWLRRTQKDVGITEPIYDTWPIAVSARALKQAEGDVDRNAVLQAAKAGDTKKLDMHLGPLRRITGEIKAQGVVDLVKEEFENGLDKIVLAYWHRDVGKILKDGLSLYGVVGIDGATSGDMRGVIEQKFLNDPKTRVFIGQIQAAGEAIDLSSAAELMFVETSFQPKDMSQMSKRITNHTQKRQPRVRVAVLEGSVDEALEAILLRKWSAIREVMK